MANQVRYTIETEQERAAQALKRLASQLDRVNKKLEQAGQKGKKSESDFVGFGTKGVVSMAKIAGSIVGATSVMSAFQQVVRLVGDEFEQLQQKQLKAAQAIQSFSTARATAILNKPSDISVSELESIVERVSRSASVSRADVFRAAAGPLSAKGAATPEAFESALSSAVNIQRVTGGAIDPNVIAGSILDVSKITGIADATTNLGFIQQFGQTSRITNPSQQAAALPPALLSGQAAGDTAEQTAELLAALTQLIGDVEGRLSTTATTQLIKQLRSGEILPRETVRRTGTGFETQIAFSRLPAELQNTNERLAFLRDAISGLSDELRFEVFEKIGGEGKARGAFEALVLGTPVGVRALESARAGIQQPGPGTRDTAIQKLSEIGASPAQQVRDIADAARFATSEISTDPERGLLGVLRTQLEEISRLTQPAIATRILNLRQSLSGGLGIDASIQHLRGIQRTLSTETILPPSQFELELSAPREIPNPQFDPRVAELIGQLIRAMQENTNTTARNTSVMQNEGSSATSAGPNQHVP